MLRVSCATRRVSTVRLGGRGAACCAPTNTARFTIIRLTDRTRSVLYVEVGVVFFQVREFGQIVVDDVGLAHVRLEIVLVILLGAIERSERRDLRDDF